MSLTVDIEKSFGAFTLKAEFHAENETLALLGASGCGKSMTLKCIAGIEKPDRGRIIADGITLFDSDKGINLPPQQRNMGLMFQNYALFPNMTVLQNIYAGAKRVKEKTLRSKNAADNAADIIESFGISELADHYPHQLSGGQQQRVALARMLISAPRALLLDEPFSALDSHLRFRLEEQMREVIRAFGKTVILVSHDRDEVYRMADSIAIMDKGKIEAIGEKKRIFADPKTKTGAILTGCKNISRLKKLDENRIYALDWGIELQLDREAGNADCVGIRMHGIREGAGNNSFRCRVVEEIENPFSFTVMFRPLDAKDGRALGWEMEKDRWRQLRAAELDIALPDDAILLLEDKQNVD